MTTYIKLSTLEYPRHEGDIRLEHPSISANQTGENFPCPDTYAPVEWVDPPVPDWSAKEVVEQLAPENVDGSWKMRWHIRVLSDEKYAQAVAYQQEAERRVRNKDI